MKTVSRNKFFHCFRPMVDMDVMLDSKTVVDRSADLGFTYITIENHKGMKVSPTESAFPDGGCSMNSENSITLQPQKRSFSRVIKAVFFETILANRVRDRKGSPSNSMLLSKSRRQRSSDSDSDELMNLSPANSNFQFQEIKTKMGLFHSSTSLSKSIPEPKTSSTNSVKQKLEKQRNHQHREPETKSEETNKRCSVLKSGLYLLLISLTVTVLWGRICAILFTSIWLYFLPCWSPENHRCRRTESVRKWPEERESKGYKKRVIMEGLLQRKHSSSRDSIKVLT